MLQMKRAHEFNFYEKFYELSSSILVIANSEGYFEHVNSVFSELLGYTTEELLSISFFDLMHPNDVQPTRQEMARLAESKKTLDFENRYRHKLGHYCVLSWNASIDPASGLVYAEARDITEKVSLQNRLRQIEAGLQDNAIVAETDARGVIKRVNEHFCLISGYSEEELIGKTHRIVNSAHHPPEFFEDLWQTISAGDVWSGVVKNKAKDGTFYFVQTLIIPIRGVEGLITSYLAVRQDITNSLENKAAFARTLEILNETGSIAKVGGWELDVASGELTWTDETFNILEVEKQENQKPLLPEGLQLFTPEYQAVVEDAVNRAIEFGEPYSLEVEAQTAKGNVLWVYTNGKANIVDGKIASLSGTIQDINARKIAEIKYNKERQKSIQSAKLASLGELAASMAHEINNPLGIISGYTELMLQTTESEDEDAQKLETILRSCERIAHIVKSLKKFSTSGKEVTREKKSLPVIVKEAVNLAKPRLKNERIEIEIEGSQEAFINCHEIEIEQVILNLINNAIDAMAELEDKWIRIAVTEQEQSIELAVIDAGLGIPEKDHYKLFEPFYTTKRPGKGTGLGLAISKGILEEHSAKIEYDKQCEHTRFNLTFPKASA